MPFEEYNAFLTLAQEQANKLTIPPQGFTPFNNEEFQELANSIPTENVNEEDTDEFEPKKKRKLQDLSFDSFVPAPTKIQNVVQDPLYILFVGSEEDRYHLLLIRNICPDSEKGMEIAIEPFSVTVTWNLTMEANNLRFPILKDFFPSKFEPSFTRIITIPTEVDKEMAKMHISKDFLVVKLPFQHLETKKILKFVKNSLK